MIKEEIELKLRFIEVEIDMVMELRNWSKKTDRSMVAITILGFIAITLACSTSDLNALHVFSISLFTCAGYKLLVDMFVNNSSDKRKLDMLKMEKEYYAVKLRLIEEDENVK